MLSIKVTASRQLDRIRQRIGRNVQSWREDVSLPFGGQARCQDPVSNLIVMNLLDLNSFVQQLNSRQGRSNAFIARRSSIAR